MPRFLVVRFSSIGDIVLTSPVIRCLKEQVPDAEIHFLTKPAYASLFESNPYLKKVWKWEGNLKALLNDLRAQHFTMVIDLHHNLRSFRVKMALGRPSSAFSKLNVEKYLRVRFGYDRLPRLHIVDRYLATVQSLGVVNDGKGLDYFLPYGADESMRSKLPPTHQNDFIAVVCGALKATKCMPAEMLASICTQLNKPVVLLGGPAEAATGELITEKAGANVFNACGKFSLHESAACLKHSQLVITHDTGLMHIAAAFKKPVISIWGNTIPAFGMAPYLPAQDQISYMAEVNNLSCRPCSKIGYDKCPKGHFRCMRDQDLESIIRQANHLSGN